MFTSNEELAEQAQEENQTCATLLPFPRNLHTLWNEYEFGIGGRKAAKDFTPQERGRVKHKYCRRKVVWDKVSVMVRSGWDANEAINKIYEVYGANQTVTKIIDKMKRDRANGGHPSLRINSTALKLPCY